MTEEPGPHPLLTAIVPLVERVGGSIVPHDRLQDGDVPLVWDGAVVAGVRLPAAAPADGGPAGETVGDLALILDAVTVELGSPLAALSRPDKQRAVRLLEERGAFAFRKSTETVAQALGVSRFTIYNYLNRGRTDAG